MSEEKKDANKKLDSKEEDKIPPRQIIILTDGNEVQIAKNECNRIESGYIFQQLASRYQMFTK